MKEKCVICNKETKYDIDDHIGHRLFYVEGAGQLCSSCYKKLYKNLMVGIE